MTSFKAQVLATKGENGGFNGRLVSVEQPISGLRGSIVVLPMGSFLPVINLFYGILGYKLKKESQKNLQHASFVAIISTGLGIGEVRILR